MKQHHYKAHIAWTGNSGEGTQTYQSYERNFEVAIDGKPNLQGSADPAFRGDASRYNPEDMLLTALSSCHMLWFLHLCADKGIIVTAYEDHAEGFMQEQTGGMGGRFTRAVLHPVVTITDESRTGEANDLHKEAGKRCFITNSCNFPVEYMGICTV